MREEVETCKARVSTSGNFHCTTIRYYNLQEDVDVVVLWHRGRILEECNYFLLFVVILKSFMCHGNKM